MEISTDIATFIASKVLRPVRRIRAAALRLLVLAPLIAHGGNALALSGAAEKAGLLRNFVEFVYWPIDFAQLRVCTLGEDQLERALDAWAGLRIRGMKIELRRQVPPSTLDACDVIYVSAAVARYLPVVVATLRDKPVLVVADVEGAAQIGATLSLRETREGRIGFDVNLSAAKRVGLRLDSRLTRLAVKAY